MEMIAWLRARGIPVPVDPDINAIGAAVALIVAANALGWWLGARAGPRLSALANRWLGRAPVEDGSVAGEETGATIVGQIATAVPLLLAMPAFAPSPFASALVAAALGVAAARLAYALLRPAGLCLIFGEARGVPDRARDASLAGSSVQVLREAVC